MLELCNGKRNLVCDASTKSFANFKSKAPYALLIAKIKNFFVNININ